MARRVKRSEESGKKGHRRKAKKPAKSQSPGFFRRVALLVRWSLITAIWGFVLLGSVLAWYAYDLPDIEGLASASRRPGASSRAGRVASAPR